MSGEAKTNSFMLSTATVMIGAQDKLFDLNPTEHSIGLVKNFTMTADPTYTELTQGVKNTLVFSVMTANPVKASMEVYEYTSKNLLYGLGLDGSTALATPGKSTLATAITGDGTATDTVSVKAADGSKFTVGNWIFLYDTTNVDVVFAAKISSIATDTLTIDRPVPTGMTFAANTTNVQEVNRIDIGSKVDQPFLSSKVAGTLADGSEVVILIPKMRVTKGFNFAFHTDQFGNLPFEFSVYNLVNTDPLFSDFPEAPAAIFTNG